MSGRIGLNRFVWDLRHERPPALRYGYSIAAAYGEDAIKLPQGPLVVPGMYQVKLTANGRTQVAPLEVKLDPRLRVPAVALAQQLALEMKITNALQQSFAAAQQVNGLRSQLKELQTKVGSEPSTKSLVDAIAVVDKKAAELVAVEQGWPPVGIVSVATLNGALGNLLVWSTAPTRANGTSRNCVCQLPAVTRSATGEVGNAEEQRYRGFEFVIAAAPNARDRSEDLLTTAAMHLMRSAALPPDVRKVYDLPESWKTIWGFAPKWAQPQIEQEACSVGRSRHRTSGGKADSK